MEREDLSHHRRRSSYFSGCMVSPVSTCLPVLEELEYSRIQYSGSGSGNGSSNKRASRRWRNFLRRLVRVDGINKSTYGSNKHLSFHYDAVSYSQNFDEGCHCDESGRCPPGFSRRSMGLIT